MTVPAIKNYQQSPPAGGWGLPYTFRGQTFQYTGSWRAVTEGIARLLRRNNAYNGMAEIFDYTNEIWCRRDPNRCMSPAERSAAQKVAGHVCATCGGRRRIR